MSLLYALLTREIWRHELRAKVSEGIRLAAMAVGTELPVCSLIRPRRKSHGAVTVAAVAHDSSPMHCYIWNKLGRMRNRNTVFEIHRLIYLAGIEEWLTHDEIRQCVKWPVCCLSQTPQRCGTH